MTRALTEQQIRAVIRAHPDVFREIAMIDAHSAGDLSQQVTTVLFRHPEVLESIAANEKSAIMRWLALPLIIAETQRAHSPEALMKLAYEEFARLAFDGESSDRIMRVVFGEAAEPE